MKYTFILLCVVGFAYSSSKLELTFINRALTKLLETELKDLETCARDKLKCKSGKTYPECLDAVDDDKDSKFDSSVDVENYFILKVMKLDLKGTMELTEAQFKGVSEFEVFDIESKVTVIPLGIEFKFTLQWKGNVDLKSKFDVSKVKYKDTNKPFVGAGNMDVHSKRLGFKVVAHKLLGNKMDILKITPLVEELDVQFDEFYLGSTNLAEVAKKKFTTDFVKNGVQYDLLAEYIMKFFNDKLYPSTSGKQRMFDLPDTHILSQLGKCIAEKFPK